MMRCQDVPNAIIEDNLSSHIGAVELCLKITLRPSCTASKSYKSNATSGCDNFLSTEIHLVKIFVTLEKEQFLLLNA